MKHPSTGISIREANSADVAEMTAVFEAAFSPLRLVYRPTKAALARQADHPHNETRLVAEVDGQIVATVQYDQHEKYLHMIGLAVHPEFQRRGIAGCLLDCICDRALAIGKHAVMIDTIRETGNVPLFEKLDFRVVNETIAAWCTSENHRQLHDVKMERSVVET
ncbi:MAG: GNAT family N-acetyltransferase [Planctomycetes bacterium]|nr:GNAT family N-acetyltransferase [Planctomycetota bacterium]